jgi:hypothetical protein
MIQITINDKLVKRMVADYIGDQLMDFTDKDLKAAGLPSRKQLVEQTLADEKFQKALAKQLAKVVNDGDRIFDALQDIEMPAFDAVNRKLVSFEGL